MIFRTPQYYDKFRCSADKCSDNCCIGWEIDIDDSTLNTYRNTKGEFGDRLKQSISNGCFVLTHNDRCPFLNKRNLCDIYIELGEKSLCQICTDHPRFYEWFGNIKEGGTGLCCEESAKLILANDFVLTETEIPDEECDIPDEVLFSTLLNARQLIIFHLQNDSSLAETVEHLLSFTEELQFRIDNYDFTIPEWNNNINPKRTDIKDILEFLLTLEPIDDKWIPFIKKSIEYSDLFTGIGKEYESYMRRIAVYFVYRYFLKGVYDGEIISKIKLAVLSTWIIGFLWCFRNDNSLENMSVTAKNYSKEIEYSTDNLETLFDVFYKEEFFSSECLSGLFM